MIRDDKKRNYTPAGYQALLDELEEQKAKQEQNKKDISTARSFGDLSENSEYDEAKNEQGRIAARIAELEDMIAHAVVIDESQVDASVVGVGSFVRVRIEETGKVKQYHIVGSFESDPLNGQISDVSPIGSALMGNSANAVVEVTLPSGKVQHITILEVSR
ncbi:MAG: transcription elongation factor GreA [Clostridia bacterium]|nr:transcription elongation factor GreA [Clostridia bacterium]